MAQTSPGLQCPMFIVYAAPFGGFILVLIRLIQDIYKIVKENCVKGGAK